MISYKMARRSFIRTCGGSAALLVPLLRSIEARAQGAPAPLRFLVIHHPLGASPGLGGWRPTASATTKTFTLPVESAPFAPLQSKMVMIDGLNIVTASRVSGGNNGGQNTHEGGVVAMMTGVPTLGPIGQQDHAAGGASMDQLFLNQSPILGAGPRGKDDLASLRLAADIRSDRDEIGPRVLSYKAPITNSNINMARQPLYPETAPLNTYNTYFARYMGSNGAAILARKQSVLDFIRSDLTRLRTLIPAGERGKLDTHAAAVSALETNLRTMYGSTTGGPPSCVVPTTPPESFNMNGTGQTVNGVPSALSGVDYYLPPPAAGTDHPHQRLGQAHLASIQAAFTCDLVRVATFMWSAGTNWVVFPASLGGATVNGNRPSVHHQVSHVSPTTDPATRDWLNQINVFYSQQTANFLTGLDSVIDIDGNSLLDNTVVAYITEVARAWDHNQTNMPLILFGGKNTRLNGGTFVKVTGGPLAAQNDPTGAAPSSGTGNRPFNDMWMALAPVFGVNLPSLGNQGTQWTGPLPNVVV